MQVATAYEGMQNFNWMTRFLHGGRFNNLLDILAELKREIPDRPIEVLELGCNTGRAFGEMDMQATINYRGIDLDREAIEVARQRYADRSNARFTVADAADPTLGRADIVIALETLEHIPEAAVVRIVENICQVVRPRLFVVSVPIEIGPAIWIKYLGSKAMRYNRSRYYTWRYAWWAGLYQLNRVQTHTTHHVGFDWRWLEHTIRVNAKIRESRAMPYRWLPKWIAPSVMFVAEP